MYMHINHHIVTLAFFQYNLIPKASLSLKVLAELPIIVVLMYQLYKQHVHGEVAEFVPLIMSTIVLQPSAQQRSVTLEIFYPTTRGRCAVYTLPINSSGFSC